MISIIIVNYKVEKEIIESIDSIVESKPKVSYEIIVVDNDQNGKIEKNLKKSFFSDVKYIKSPSNIGYGGGNNLGAKFAKGDFLFFLNPDTIVEKGSIDTLCNFIKNNPKLFR